MKYRKFQQNKLWRDKAVELMEATGSKMTWITLNDEQFAQELKVKFMEEAHEVVAAKNQRELVEEFADIVELIMVWCKLYGLTLDDGMKVAAQKREKRGGFDKRMYITTAEHLEGSFGEQYCLANLEKYPEIVE